MSVFARLRRRQSSPRPSQRRRTTAARASSSAASSSFQESALADPPSPPSSTAAFASPTSSDGSASSSPQPAVSSAVPSDVPSSSEAAQLTFNLQILSDHGIILCPGFQRSDKPPFTSSSLLASLGRRTSTSTTSAPQQSNADFPALQPSSEVRSRYSPTVLPPSPWTAAKDDNGTVAASPPSAVEELTISFSRGTFSVADAPSSSASLSEAVQSSSAAASSVLKRLSFSSWRSPSSSLSQSQDASSAFPPSSALLADQDEEEPETQHRAHSDSPSGRHVEEEREDAEEKREEGRRSVEHSSPAAAAAAKPAELPAGSAAVDASTSTPAPTARPAAVSSAVPTVTEAAASPSRSLFSLPFALWSSISSFFFPSRQPSAVQPPASDTSPPPPAAPPPPPPPYAATVRRIVIIGIHGWSLLGGMLGEKALLVSSRFCYLIQQATLHYYEQSHPDLLPALRITCIPLYGHGRVEERVATYLDSQLPQYADELRRAEHVIVACHSQGCMVTSALLYALLTAAPSSLSLALSPRDVTVLMMAGLHHGPFPDLPGDLYTSTKELFFYSHAHSSHSQQHMERVAALVASGVKLLLVGSVHDGVVPLYSSLAHLLGSNGNVLRAMYADYAHYAPDFLYSFLSLLLYITNTTDTAEDGRGGNDVLPHLSGFVRGSVLEKQGGAHSAMHRCVDVYGLAVEFALSARGTAAAADTATAPGRLRTYSAVVWSHHLSDAFTTGRFNRHMLAVRAREMVDDMTAKGVPGLDVEEEKRRLRLLYRQWQPRTKGLRVMKEALQPVLATEQSSSAPVPLQSNL